jgi:serine/threonine protein kinase
VDIWSLGGIVFVILSGTFPFFETSEDPTPLRENVIKGEFKFPTDDQKEHLLGAEARDLISRAMVVDPAKRLDIDEFLAHPWMREEKDAGTDVKSSTSDLAEDMNHIAISGVDEEGDGE